MSKNVYERVHTFSRRPGCQQITAYIVCFTQIIIFYTLIQTNISNAANRISAIVLFSLTLILQICLTAITSMTDPCDAVMLQYRNGDKSKILPEIDTCLYCDNCNSYVKSSSRHCKICNRYLLVKCRCVSQFDHHCVWINNCIGKDNYKGFIGMIVSTASNMAMFIMGGAMLWQQGNYPEYLSQMVVIWIMMAIIAVFLFLLINLIILHIYLMYLGVTTYEFIMKRREKAKQHQKNPAQKVDNDLNDITEENVVVEAEGHHQNKVNNLGNMNEVIFADQVKTSEQASSELQMMPMVATNKSSTVPVESIPATNTQQKEDKQLKEFYQNHKSLKLLIGQAVAIKPLSSTSKSLDRNYFSANPNHINPHHINPNKNIVVTSANHNSKYYSSAKFMQEKAQFKQTPSKQTMPMHSKQEQSRYNNK